MSTSNKGYQRWLQAQDAEKQFWSFHGDEHLTREYWNKLIRRGFDIGFDFFSVKDVLEIGAGPSGVIFSIEDAKSRTALEPMDMNDLLGSEPLKRKIVRRGVAEDLPFDDNTFDIVVCFNVLDHCYDPYTVLKECHRALRNSGSLLLWIHALRNKYHVFQHLLNRIDRPHPNHFTTEQIKRMAEDHFSLQSLKIVKGAGIYGYAPYNGNLKLLLANYLTENVWLNFRKM